MDTSRFLAQKRRIKQSLIGGCVAATLAALGSGCAGKTTTPGQLIVAFQTDMSLPKDVDEVRVEVTSFGNVVFKNRYPVGAGGLRIPATLGILSGPNARALVTIRVIAMQRNRPRMLREIVTTVPTSRVAMLRLPIQWLSDGSATMPGVASGDPLTGDEPVQSTCPGEQTSVAGECVDWNVDSATLPDYAAGDVFGGGNEEGTGGSCFDTLGCMKGARVVQPDGACAIAPPAAAPGKINVALRLPPGGDGICDEADCFIPLDSAAGTGWSGTSPIALPPSVCRKIAEGLPAKVVVATNCPTKTPSLPTCGPWSPVSGLGPVSKDDGRSHITLDVEGEHVDIDCTHLDQDFSKFPPEAALEKVSLGGTSASTGLAFFVAVPGVLAPYKSGSVAGTYALLDYEEYSPSSSDYLLGLRVKFPKGTARYTTQAERPSAAAFHTVSTKLVNQTPASATYRIHGEFLGTFRKVDGAAQSVVPATGTWSLLLTFPVLAESADAGTRADADR